MASSTTSINGQKVRFGQGLRNDICAELSELGSAKALVLSTPQQVDMAMELATTIGDRAAGVFTRATMHTPVDVTEEAVEHAQSVQADSIVSIGGGSTIGLGKAIALRTGLPQIAVPTTYAGSEATPILGQTEGGIKTTLTDPKVLPRVILYDPELVASLPPAMTVTSALNAMAHAAEALYAKDRTEQTTELAIDGLKAFATGLPKVIEQPGDLTARAETQKGAWACGTVLGLVGMALHHKLCHTLGGSFNLPHAETHAIVLPHAIAYNAQDVPELLAPISKVLGGTNPGQALWSFAEQMGAPMALKDLGLAEADLDRATEIALKNPYWNPRPITADGLRVLLQNAWAGNAPSD
ncbi:maleylacetate reductase [Ruegeria sp. R14_0]|uniref:maleylacetate reductase n=1 Tax=Ruegeria sp. R14_0 TaxID=2821100 RepID=UPI001ADBDC8F|nr:maleylacetate reductase [Ruegeria sp. R14_0]MBO9448317.1 maleylacetate reductase [Ruegeria sp. R14_0]